MPSVETQLVGTRPDAALIAQIARAAHDIDALDDPAYPAWYRQRLAVAMTERADLEHVALRAVTGHVRVGETNAITARSHHPVAIVVL